MTLRTLIRNPLAAAVLGVAIGAPVAVLYGGVLTADPAQAAPPAVAAKPDPSPAPAPFVAPGLPDFSSMVQRYGPAVVNISVVARQSTVASRGGDDGDDDDSDDGQGMDPFGPNSPFAPFFRGMPYRAPQQQPIHGEGSGFIIRPDGVILTNAHVVNGATEVTVRLTDRREYTAKVIGSDPRADVAVIKINGKDLPTVRLGDSKGLKVGEWVLAIGAPFGFDNSATAGIVSAKGRVLQESYVPFIQTDVPINPGNSGGPLFNLRGEVVGINSQIYSRTGGYMGVSFSIPIDVALQVSKQLEATGRVSRGKLGVQIQQVTQGLADSFGLPRPEGALVSTIEKNGAAEKAGIEPGDVILKLNGKVVNQSDELPVEIASLTPGTTVNLEVWRNHASRNVTATLGSLDSATRTATNRERANPGGRLGLAVRPITPNEQRRTHIASGLVIEQVSGPALDAGLQPGDVVLRANGVTVSTVEELRGVVEKSKGHVALLVQHGDRQVFVPVRIG